MDEPIVMVPLNLSQLEILDKALDSHIFRALSPELEEARDLRLLLLSKACEVRTDKVWQQSWNVVHALEQLIHVRTTDQDGRRAAADLVQELYTLVKKMEPTSDG